jgi:hypothetical protein
MYEYSENKGWCRDMKNLFIEMGCEYYYTNKTVCNISEIKNILTNIEGKKWEAEISNKPKLRTYKEFKSNKGLEKYLNSRLNRRQKVIFAQFRAGVLQLKIETGRYTAMPLAKRVCEICQEQVIEDEFHFLMKCPRYNIERTNLFNAIELHDSNFKTKPDYDKFMLCMNTYQILSAKHIYICWEKRSKTLYK